MPLTEEFKKKLREEIMAHGAICYVFITPDTGFYLFKVSGEFIESGQEIKPEETYMNYNFSYASGVQILRKSCAILHGEELYNRFQHSNVVEGVLNEYEIQIADSPEFMIMGCFDSVDKNILYRDTEIGKKHSWTITKQRVEKVDLNWNDIFKKLTKNDWVNVINSNEVCLKIELDKERKRMIKIFGSNFSQVFSILKESVLGNKMMTEFDYLVPKKGFKPIFPKHFTPINKLLREIGLLKEHRGKIKSVDVTTKYLRAFIIKEFKSIKRRKPLPLTILKNKLEQKLNRLFPNDAGLANKYNWSTPTIRRILEDFIKK